MTLLVMSASTGKACFEPLSDNVDFFLPMRLTSVRTRYSLYNVYEVLAFRTFSREPLLDRKSYQEVLASCEALNALIFSVNQRIRQ